MNTPKSLLIGLALAAGAATSVLAQGEVASGSVTGSGTGPYSYSMSFSDATSATASIGSIWYAWTPTYSPFFYLPSTPTTASGPTGWNASIDGDSIQFTASSSIYDIAPGGSLSGFHFTATFSPTTLAGTAMNGYSYAYKAGIEGDAGEFFNVVTVVPEPSALMLLVPGAGALWLMARRKVRFA